MRKFFALCITLMAMLIFAIFVGGNKAAAADIDLGEGYHVPSNFSSVLITSSDGTAIQNAVEHIQAGGVILLSGSFNLKRNINIKKDLTIKGDDNKAALNAETLRKSDRVIRCQGNIVLENLKIMGGNSTNGGGVKIDGGNVTMTNCEFSGNSDLLGGGGIHSQAKTLTLTNCNISDNKVVLMGGGMSLLSGNSVTMTNCTVSSNTAMQGGGIASAGAAVTMTDCKVTGNTASQSGGGITLLSGTITAVSCDVTGNIASLAERNESADIELSDGAVYKLN